MKSRKTFSTRNYILLIEYLIFSFSLVFLLCAVNRNVQINVLYASIEGSPQGLTNLYYDNGNGLREEECIYQKIENNRVIYEFHPQGYVNKIRILSNRLPGQIVYLKSINVLIDNYLVGKLEKNTLINSIVPSESSVSVHTFKDNIKLSKFENG